MVGRGGIYDGMHGDGRPVDEPREVTRQSCGCIRCDLGHVPCDGHMGVMVHDYGMDEVFACTKPRN